MYILNNAVKNIGRNKGRYLLMGLIILITITVSIVSLSINNTTNGIIDDYKTRFGSEVTIAPDMSKLASMGDLLAGRGERIKQITPQQYLDFAQSSYLKEVVLTASAGVAGDGIQAVDEDKQSGMMGGIGLVVGGASGQEDYKMPTMNLIGNQWDEFQTGYRTLMDGGRMPTNADEAIISKELADLNHLKVGDTIKVVSSIISIENNEPKTINREAELTITGIYLDATEAYTSSIQLPSLNRRNDILTTMDTLINHFGNGMRVNAKYVLKHPSMLKDFEAELRAKGLDERYLVSTDEAGYQKVVGPVEGLRKISLTFLVMVLIFGGLILVILSSIAIRERKYEIGVLRAMGMKKNRVVLGLWLEMLIITACCLLAGVGIGTVAAQPVSDTLLAEQIEQAQQSAQQGGMLSGIMLAGGRTGEKLVPLEQVNVSVGLDSMLQITVIALVLASLASIAAIAKVTQYEPIKILMERH